MNNFTIIIASPPDREKLVAEIWYKQNTMIAEINQENEKQEIILYTSEKSNFELDELIVTLKMAKDRLLN
jgi:hypothetical protein